MNLKIKSALVSVFDKENIPSLLKCLKKHNIKIIRHPDDSLRGKSLGPIPLRRGERQILVLATMPASTLYLVLIWCASAVAQEEDVQTRMMTVLEQLTAKVTMLSSKVAEQEAALTDLAAKRAANSAGFIMPVVYSRADLRAHSY